MCKANLWFWFDVKCRPMTGTFFELNYRSEILWCFLTTNCSLTNEQLEFRKKNKKCAYFKLNYVTTDIHSKWCFAFLLNQGLFHLNKLPRSQY